MRTPGHGERRLLSIVDRRSAAPRAALHARRERVPVAVRHPRAVARITRTIRIVLPVDGHEHRVDYEPGESTHRAVRRQLELARPDLVPGELPADRVAAEVPSLLRRRLHGRVPDRLGPDADAVGSRRRALAPADAHLPARRRRPAAGVRRRRRASSTIRTGATCVPFHEYFHGDTGAGVGASHQTGWTGLVAKLLQQQAGRARPALPLRRRRSARDGLTPAPVLLHRDIEKNNVGCWEPAATCREFVDFIMEYLDGELPSDVHTPFERHISLCPACDRYLRQYRATVVAGRAAFATATASCRRCARGADYRDPREPPRAVATGGR